jgi:hypothetical protein
LSSANNILGLGSVLLLGVILVVDISMLGI